MKRIRYAVVPVLAALLFGVGGTAQADSYGLAFRSNGIYFDYQYGYRDHGHSRHYHYRRHHYSRPFWGPPRYRHPPRYGHFGYRSGPPVRHFYGYGHRHHRHHRRW